MMKETTKFQPSYCFYTCFPVQPDTAMSGNFAFKSHINIYQNYDAQQVWAAITKYHSLNSL